MSFGNYLNQVRQEALSKFNPRRSLRGAAKFFGAAQNALTFNETAVFSVANYGGGVKLEAEAPFTAVRLIWVSRVVNAMTGSKAIVGVSDSADMGLANTAIFHPRINGVTYNTVVAAPLTLGYQAVTWNGNATVDHPAANTAAQVKVSDWIPLQSTPRTDGGTRPLLVIRAEHDGAAAGGFATFSNAAISALRTPLQAARNRIIQTFTGANMVSTPSAINGAIGTATFEIYPEFKYAVPSLNVVGVGDSTMQCESLGLSAGINNWGWRACADISTPNRPVHWTNCAAAGKTFTEFWARFVELVNAGLTTDVLVVQPLSINDYTGNQAQMAGFIVQGKARAQMIYEYAQANNIRSVIFQGLLPYNSLSANDHALRIGYNAWLKDFANNLSCGYLELGDLGDRATPERWIPAYNYLNDGIHPSEAAIEKVMAPALQAALAACA